MECNFGRDVMGFHVALMVSDAKRHRGIHRGDRISRASGADRERSMICKGGRVRKRASKESKGRDDIVNDAVVQSILARIPRVRAILTCGLFATRDNLGASFQGWEVEADTLAF